MSDHARCWTIKRNCSASPKQLALVFSSIVAVSFVFGAAFAAQGLWLVLPFVGVEMLAVTAAFICYGRKAADYERIEIDAAAVSVETVEGNRRSIRRLPSPWVRVEVQHSGGGLAVWLAAGAERLQVGRHLREARRAGLAKELREALRMAVPA